MPAIPGSHHSCIFSAVASTPIATILCSLMLCAPIWAQEATQAGGTTPRPLITQSVDESRLTTLSGNTHPLARPEFDLGTAPASLPMKRMLMVLKRSPDQEASLEKLLDDQQNKTSPNYHSWLSPEQYGLQFGPTDADIQTVTAWLQSHGFEVIATKGRSVLEFSGTAGQVEEAFHTAIHKYIVKGEQHWANVADPQIPTALTPAVAGVASLNNFPKHAMNVPAGVFSREKATGKIRAVQPQFTFPSGCVEDNLTSNSPCLYALGPYDFATVYNVLPLWNTGINGAGQTIAIVGETNINLQDVSDFRSLFGLPANNPTIILNGPDPGIQGDESEADIDVQWSGAVAPNATIDFVVSQSTETTAGIDLSAVYIVENNLAPVMSESYGYCELALGTSGNQFYSALWQQAAAQGITVFISAGDNGSAGCDNFNAASPAPAQSGLQVNGFASTPYNVAVGGTDFNDFSNPSTYWSTTNNSTTQASALSYIPETTWNDSCTNALFGTLPGLSTNPETNCNDYRLAQYYVIPEGGSGGASNCTTPNGASCAGGYAKPSWQSGKGVPADGKRDIPDVSLFASNGFVGSFYIVCQSDQTSGSCNLNNPYASFLGFGGTSVASPAFAGIMALVNQETGSRQGNANYVFYKLAAQQPTAFHDVTSGTIAMPCATGSLNCNTTSAGDAYGILSGYNAGAGYDLATGLGSVDADNLVTKWTSVSLLPSATTVTSLTPTTITHGQAVNFSVTVKPGSGTGSTPTGLISLEGSPFNLTNGTAAGSTDLLPGGTYSVIAHYQGDSTYAASDSAPVSVTVTKENSQPQTFLVTFDANGNIISNNTTTATYGTPYLLRVNVENSAGKVCAPVATSGATACPSGTVTLTNNGSALDAGTYALNSYGYFEDQTVQLPGGTDSVKAAYAGDGSFNANTSTSTITVTPAATELSAPTVLNYSLGYAFNATTKLQSESSGAAPTGTVTFLLNGSPMAGTANYAGVAGTGSPPVALLYAGFTTPNPPITKAGSYSISASYSGDGNYAPSISSITQILAQYPQPLINYSPSVQNVNVGATATVNAVVDAMNKKVYPTGTVTFTVFSTGAVLGGPTPCTSTTDSSGNYACQASVSFVATTETLVVAQYSGDTNYPATNGSPDYVNVNDFTIGMSLNSVTASQGQSQTIGVNIGDEGAFNGTVSTFSCSGLPAETTCSFNPPQVTGFGATTLTITTTPLGQLRRRAARESHRIGWAAISMLPLLWVCLIGIPAWRRRGALSALVILALFLTTPGCGGGGGGGQVNNNPVPSITSLSPTEQAAGSGSQALTITGSGFVSGSMVTYNNVAHTSSYAGASQVSISLTPTDLATAGSYPVIVTNPTPGGGVSGAVNFNVVSGTPAGSFNITVRGTSGSLTHTANFTLIIQ